ncbi:MraY family glycosyltransferase [Swaminathania salitolerans]|nr:UDP-phosphate alpha N-acetylglucosaminyltransferase [Swaminathania salitolerans]
MIPLILSCLVACILSAGLVRRMVSVGVMDVPGHRSSHERPTPKGGGVGIVTAFLIALPLDHIGLTGHLPGWSLLLPEIAIAGLAFFSWRDDIHSYPAMAKLAVQGGAAALVVIVTLAFPEGPAALPLYLACALPGFLWLVYVTNALNFIDGLNGLASGSMALSSLGLALLFHLDGETLLRNAALLLGCALLAFLPFNFPRARIFMGDVGSQGAGLALSWLGLEAMLRSTAPWMPLFLLAGILGDVAFTLVRRGFAGNRLTEAHRGHLYQLAVRSGIPAPAVTLLHWGFVLWGGAIGLAPLDMPARLALLLAPQLGWGLYVLARARRHISGAW